MRSVNIARLKNQLSRYISYARNGEEIVIRDRNLPVAKIVAFSAEDADERDLALIAAGKMRPAPKRLNLKKFFKARLPRVAGNGAIEALLAERDED